MAKYVLEEYVINGYNASSKAREDVSKILLDYGYRSIAKNDKRNFSNSKIKKTLMALKIYGKLAVSLKKDDILFLQTSLKVLKGILKVKKIAGFQIIYLIHDMFCLRYDNYEEHKTEISENINSLNKCEYIICHNKKMRQKLIEFGCKSNILTLEIFDYLIDDTFKVKKRLYKPFEIAFAGNLSKSPFLYDLDISNIQSISFNVYGVPIPTFSNLNYKGSVSADLLPSVIEGNYGLIWESEYCIKEKDNYTRYNNPHKASLYIVSGLPLIVWRKSAIADFVIKYKVGITVDSLDELKEKISNISEEDYKIMQMHCNIIRNNLVRGHYLKKILNSIDIDRI